MSKILKFEDFALLENGSPAFALSGGYPRSSIYNHQINDYSLSSDPSDRFTANMKSGIFRLTSVIKTFMDTGMLQTGEEGEFADLSLLAEFKILRMFKNVNFLLDIYVSFVINEIEYYGVFKDFGGIKKPEFKSEIQLDPEYNKNFFIKLEGTLLRALDKFFTPKKGVYTCTENVPVQDKYGVKHIIKKDMSVKVEDVLNDEDNSYIKLDVKVDRNTNETFFLKGLDYYYFNYWFRTYSVKDANA